MLKDKKYKYNQTIISTFGCGNVRKIRVCTIGCLRTAGVEDESCENAPARGTVNEDKLENNLSRTKRTIYELALSNPWEYFFTGTLDRKKYDRQDLEKFVKHFTQWLRDQGKKYSCKIRYLLIPELHSDGKSWHLHGFLMGIPPGVLERFRVGKKMGKYLAKKVKNGACIYDWPAYRKKFGFCDLEPIGNQEACAKYCTKYITKDLARSVTELNAHQYYCSKGLARAEVIKKGTMVPAMIPSPDYVGQYCSVAEFPFDDALLAQLLDGFYPETIVSHDALNVNRFDVLPDWVDTPWDPGVLPDFCADLGIT